MKRSLPTLALVAAFFALAPVASASGSEFFPGFDTAGFLDSPLASTTLTSPTLRCYRETFFGVPFGSATALGGGFSGCTSYNNDTTGSPVSVATTSGVGEYFHVFFDCSANGFADNTSCNNFLVAQGWNSDPESVAGSLFYRWNWDGSVYTGYEPSAYLIDLSVSTTTETARITGYALNPTDSYEFEVYIEQFNPAYGYSNLLLQNSFFGHITPTTTGFFSYTFDLAVLATSSATTTAVIGREFELTAYLDRLNLYAGYDAPLYRENIDSLSESFTNDFGIDILNPYDLESYPEVDCSTDNGISAAIQGCLKSAAIWLFYPTPSSLDAIKNVSLASHAPFSYAYDIGALRDELFNSAQTATSTIMVDTPIGEITFLSRAMMESVPYSSTIKTVLGYVLWILFAEYVYLMTLNAFRKSHT
jgi:hypothetical protein